jgi:hypothetical protein
MSRCGAGTKILGVFVREKSKAKNTRPAAPNGNSKFRAGDLEQNTQALGPMPSGAGWIEASTGS